MKDTRKVQGEQWYITLPKEWRNSDGHAIKKGDSLHAYYNPNALLILNPEERKMLPLEENLVDILINLPSLIGTRELVEKLKGFVVELESS